MPPNHMMAGWLPGHKAVTEWSWRHPLALQPSGLLRESQKWTVRLISAVSRQVRKFCSSHFKALFYTGNRLGWTAQGYLGST